MRCRLGDCGVHRYTEDESFAIILLAYSWDHGQTVHVLDIAAGDQLPEDVYGALLDPGVLKIAHNANFEMVCIGAFYGLEIYPEEWYCTMVGAAYLGLPLSLDKLGDVLAFRNKKDAKGKALIKFFCMPCKPAKANGFRTRNLPGTPAVEVVNEKTEATYLATVAEKWAAFGSYNGDDVRAECEVWDYVLRFPKPPAAERTYWLMDQVINARGLYLDLDFIEAAIWANAQAMEAVHYELQEITGLANVNSPAQLRAWLGERLGQHVPSIGKEYLAEAMGSKELPEDVARVIELRQEGSRTSISKYATMLAWRCLDNCIKGLVQYYGANRTGRWAGRGIQPQNLKKTIKDAYIATAKEAIRQRVADLMYNDVPDLISKLVRTAIIARPGNSLAVCDYSAIEGRILAWLAGEDWKLDVYRGHGKMYEAVASVMFNIPIEEVTKTSPARAKGKIAELALGYQGGSGALITMGALREGLAEDELPGIVSRWRVASPKTVKFWRLVENAAKDAIRDQRRVTLRLKYTELHFSYEKGYLFIQLPSGRRLAYFGARCEQGRLIYWGVDQTKKIWVRMQAYGGLITENITQAVARDCLADGMARMYDDVNIILHVHDEIVADVPDDQAVDTLKYMEKVMSVSPLWASTLPLKGDGWVSKYYKKD